MNRKKITVILIHAFIGWALCAALMGIGMSITTLGNALMIHAAGAPVFFIIVSIIYFLKFSYTKPLQTALIFIAFVIAVDFFLVALIINRNLDMFTSFQGTWLPFILIFFSTYVTGLIIERKGVTRK